MTYCLFVLYLLWGCFSEQVVLLSLTYARVSPTLMCTAGEELFSHYLCMLVYYFLYVCMYVTMNACMHLCMCMCVGEFVCMYIHTYIYI